MGEKNENVLSKEKNSVRILEDGEIEEDDNIDKALQVDSKLPTSSGLKLKNTNRVTEHGTDSKEDCWRAKSSRFRRRRRKVENYRNKDRKLYLDKRKCETTSSYNNNPVVPFKKRRNKEVFRRKRNKTGNTLLPNFRFQEQPLHSKDEGGIFQYEKEHHRSRKKFTQSRNPTPEGDLSFSSSVPDSAFSRNSFSHEDSSSSGSESYYSELESHLKKSHGANNKNHEREKADDDANKNNSKLREAQRPRQRCFYFPRRMSPPRDLHQFPEERSSTERERKSRKLHCFGDDVNDFDQTNRMRRIRPFQDKPPQFHSQRHDFQRRSMPHFDLRPTYRHPPDFELKQHPGNFMVNEMMRSQGPPEQLRFRSPVNPILHIPFNFPRLMERLGGPFHAMHDIRSRPNLENSNQHNLKTNDKNQVENKMIPRQELPVDKTPPTPSVASLMSSPPRFTFPLAPPLFNPNNYSGGLLPIGGNRMVQPMPTTCLPPPHAGLLCPLPRPPLLLPSPIMQGILPTILPPAATANFPPPWIHFNHRQPSHEMHQLQNLKSSSNTNQATSSPTKKSLANNDNDEDESDQELKKICENNGVIKLDDPDVIELDDPDVIKVCDETAKTSLDNQSNVRLKQFSSLHAAQQQNLSLDKENKTQSFPSLSSTVATSNSSNMVLSIMQMVTRKSTTSSSVDTNLLSKVANVISFTPPAASESSTKNFMQAPQISSNVHSHQSASKKQKLNRNDGNSIRLILKRNISVSELRREPCNIPLISTKNFDPKNSLPDPRLEESRLIGKEKSLFAAPVASLGSNYVFKDVKKGKSKFVENNSNSNSDCEGPNKPVDPRMNRCTKINFRLKSKYPLKNSENPMSGTEISSKEYLSNYSSHPAPPSKPMALLRKPSTSLSAFDLSLELQNTDIASQSAIRPENKTETQIMSERNEKKFSNLPKLHKSSHSIRKPLIIKDEESSIDSARYGKEFVQSTSSDKMLSDEIEKTKLNIIQQKAAFVTDELPKLVPAPSFFNSV